MTNAELRGDTAIPVTRRILHNFGYFGHYLHVNAGGRNGKQHVLIRLLKAGGSLTQRELLDASCISSASLSEVVSKLEVEGLVTRMRSDSDRRQQVIELTLEGLAKAQELHEQKLAFESLAFSCLSSQEIDQLLELLDRVAAHWDELDRVRRDA